MKALLVLCLALCAASGSTARGVRTNVNFDVHSVVTGPDTLLLTAPDGRRLIVVGDNVLVSEIQGVEASVTRVDDVSEEEAGPAGIEISITRPIRGAWLYEAKVRDATSVGISATADNDKACDLGDDILLAASSAQSWRLTIGSRHDGRCLLELHRVGSRQKASPR